MYRDVAGQDAAQLRDGSVKRGWIFSWGASDDYGKTGERVSAQPRQALGILLTFKEARGDAEGIALLARVSPVAWQHINWYGHYEFRRPLAAINLHAIIQALMHLPVPHDPAG